MHLGGVSPSVPQLQELHDTTFLVEPARNTRLTDLDFVVVLVGYPRLDRSLCATVEKVNGRPSACDVDPSCAKRLRLSRYALAAGGKHLGRDPTYTAERTRSWISLQATGEDFPEGDTSACVVEAASVRIPLTVIKRRITCCSPRHCHRSSDGRAR
jgi:hypothetical protein